MTDDAETSAFIESMKNCNTNRKTKSDINIFSKWMIENGEMRKLEEIPPMELDKVLARFFMLAQKEDGTPYEPTTIRSYQSSINRYLKEKQNIDIMIDKDFRHSREVMSAKLKDLKSKGMGAKKRKADPFTADEIHELYEKRLLGAATPKSLLRTVWMNNCLRSYTTLRWGDIEMKSTTDGIQYLEHTERITKTRNGINHDSRPFQAKMFADSGNVRCPVEAYKQYLKRRPQDTLEEDSPFYLGCAKTVKDNIWFTRQAVGKTLLVILSEICVMKLESRTGKQTTALVHEDVPNTRIMQLSGHKNIQSINSYSTASLAQQKEMSNILTKVGTGQLNSNQTICNTNVSEPSNKCDENNNNINADLPSDDDAELLTASQEAELNIALKDINNFETLPVPTQNEVPEIIHDNYKEKTIQMFSGATITGNITINFPA